jgi:hypothetical protein
MNYNCAYIRSPVVIYSYHTPVIVKPLTPQNTVPPVESKVTEVAQKNLFLEIEKQALFLKEFLEGCVKNEVDPIVRRRFEQLLGTIPAVKAEKMVEIR